MARVYSSVRSCRILRSSTQHSVMTRLASLVIPATGLSVTMGGSTEAAGGAPGAAYVTDASFFRLVGEGVTGVVAEHVVEGHAVAELGAQVGGTAGGADRAPVHQRNAVTI